MVDSKMIEMIALPLMAIFGSLLWIMIFLQTYRHFPKMDKHQRISMSVSSATIATVAVMAIVYVFMYLLLKGL
jgi:uncharacterized membrane protein YidH (DUF202 family)